jgi:parvulin-like peptidyl-prolyl isomerase
MAGSDEAWQGWLAANLYTEAEFREDLRGALNASRVRDIVLQGYSPSGVPFVRARHILVATEAEASALLERLRSGEDFAALASQFTRDETTRGSGGDLGWFHEAQLLQPELARLAFTLEMSIIAGPIRTELGYHILQVLERENRPVSEEEYAAVAQAHFENWLFGLANDAMIERYL